METKKQGILGLQRKKFTFSRAQKHVIVQEYLTGILSKREPRYRRFIIGGLLGKSKKNR